MHTAPHAADMSVPRLPRHVGPILCRWGYRTVPYRSVHVTSTHTLHDPTMMQDLGEQVAVHVGDAPPRTKWKCVAERLRLPYSKALACITFQIPEHVDFACIGSVYVRTAT